jgi:hypothetical protein
MSNFILGCLVGAVVSLAVRVQVRTYLTPTLHEEDVNAFVDNVQSFLANLDDDGTE